MLLIFKTHTSNLSIVYATTTTTTTNHPFHVVIRGWEPNAWQDLCPPYNKVEIMTYILILCHLASQELTVAFFH